MGSACCGKSDSQTVHEKLQVRRIGNFTFKQHRKSHSVFKSAGRGCRQTAAWLTEATREEVAKKIEEFWETRVQGDPNQWGALKAACEAADTGKAYLDTAEAIVKASGLTMHQGYIMVCYDELGFKYELPPFVINEPTEYGEAKEDKVVPVALAMPLDLTVRSAKRPEVAVHINSNQTGKDLKAAYRSAAHAEGPIRLFFNGREVKDNGYLCSLSSGVVVQAMGS